VRGAPLFLPTAITLSRNDSSVPDPGASPSRPTALRQPPGELAVLLTLAAVQFTHIVDFMILMPLGPQLMRILEIGPRQFSLLVSAYTFAAAASGFVAAFWIDRFDHKRVLLVLYGGFIVATALCGLAPNYPLLLAARIIAGTFGGVIGGLVLAIVADLVPFARRATATGIVATSFSLAAVAGVPAGLWIAAHSTWRTPFLALAAASIVVAIATSRILPPLSSHLAHAVRRRPVAQLRAIFGEPNHLRTFAFTVVLMFAGFTVIPFIAPYNVANVGLAEIDLPIMYLAGGLATLVTSPIIGRLADRYGKKRVFGIIGVMSIAPILITTHLEPVSLSVVVACAVLFFVLVTGRFGPGMALISGSAEPQLRGSFMSFNASIQQLGAGLAALTAGLIIGRAPDGTLTHYGVVGWIAAACTVLAIWLASRIRIVDDGRRAGGDTVPAETAANLAPPGANG
jgi:predicted MFS family arabinose efflux permease